MPDAGINRHCTDTPVKPDCARPAPESGTYLCFDFGQKRIGLAVGHSHTKSANPLTVVRNINGRPEWHHLDERISEWKPVGLVVGLPVPEFNSESGSETTIPDSQDNIRCKPHGALGDSKQANGQSNQQLVLSAAFSRKLRHRYKLPVYRCDERYSSIEAARLLAENRSRGKRRKVGRDDLDKVAAAIILKQWFDNEFE